MNTKAATKQYPVITAHVPSSERWLGSDPNVLTTSTNRNLLQPSKVKEARRASSIQETADKGKHTPHTRSTAKSRAPQLSDMLHEESSSSASVKSGRSQLVDLVVEDTEAEETERVRARKEGGAGWNQDEVKHFA